MRINKKRITAFLLTLAMMITILPVNAFAAGLKIYAKSEAVDASISDSTISGKTIKSLPYDYY